MSDVEVTARIAAPAEQVWAMVSDVTRMGEWSPETTSCRWIDGATGPAVGARFRGSNQLDRVRRWSTTCTVTACDPGRRFAFDVRYGPVSISTWEYRFEPAGDGGCQVVEAWSDRRPTWMKYASFPLAGVVERDDHNRRGMERTLAALKAAAEQS